jgi:glyoxylase-like metal-dependent hydrolase (beta-lactamase superfamily II)
MLSWTVGKVKITRVTEWLPLAKSTDLFEAATPDAVGRHREWASPFMDDHGNLRMSIHSFVVESEGQRILVDTCVGNDKGRRFLQSTALRTPFLERLEDAGAPKETVDAVVCTHLHFDHVGWNTEWSGDRWATTFANATYLFGGEEWEYWSKREAQGDPDGLEQDRRGAMADSVLPVFEADQAKLVEVDHRLTSEIRLEPTPGHTPGHVSVWISSEGAEAVITGDMVHHPLQIAEPTWCLHADSDPLAAAATRKALFERCATQPILVIGTHFPPPTAGYIVADGKGWRLAPV